MITPGGRSTKLADIGRKKIIVDGVIAGVRRVRVPTDTGGKRAKVIVGLVRDKSSVTRVLIGDMTLVTTSLVWPRKDGCSHGRREGRPSWQAENTR